MKKFTKLVLVLALLVIGVSGAKVYAGKYHAVMEQNWYCNASWNSGTNTMSWTGVWTPPAGSFGSTFYFLDTHLPSGDITSYTKFHATLSNFSDNIDHIWLRIKQGDNNYADAKLVAGENNIDLAALATANPGVDFAKVTDITLWGAREALEEKTIDGEHPASVVVTNVYLYKPTDVITNNGFGDAITSLDYITDGGKFVISDNGTNAKFFKNRASNAHESQNAAVGDITADSYFYFTLEKYSSGDNIYRLKITNANGDGYPYGDGGSSNYYLNTVQMYTDNVISAQETGWGGEQNALWYVTYDAEKGFSFQSVYRKDNDKDISWLSVGNLVADQQYLKLYKSINFVVNSELDPMDENVEITVGGDARNYQLYVPNTVQANCPLVISLHGANGASTNYSPFKKSVADAEGCIVAYPQGKVTNFPIGFDGDATGWTASGEDNFDVDFIKAVIEDVASKYQIDRKRIYCCGFSNGGMMTYALSNTCSDIFAAFASISGYPINEFHLRHAGERPVPFLHIHGKADDFVLYSKMPTIVDEMVARLGANPVPTTTSGDGYTKNVYEAAYGSFPYVYYEIDGMGHVDFTDKTEDGSSAQTMWNFFEQYTLDSSCNSTLKWAPRIEQAGFAPASHGLTMNSGTTLLQFGGDQYTVDNKNVYHSLQFDNGNYMLSFSSTGAAVSMGVQIQKLTTPNTVVLDATVNVGDNIVLPFEVADGWGEYQLTITRPSESDAITISNIVIKEGSETVAFVKTPLLLLKNGAINTTDFDVTPIASSTLTTDNLYAATFTSKGGYCNTFKYENLDVSDYDKAVIVFGEPLSESNGEWHINLPNGNHIALPSGTDEYVVSLDGVDTYGDFTVFSWNHSGKSITISEAYLLKYVDPLRELKATLSEKIAEASLYSSVGKTAASFDALTQAISDGETALAANDATEQSLTDATTAITDAINGLTLAENYTLLTKEMFKQYASLAEPGEGSNGNGAYELFTASGLPYGDGNVSELKWADLAAYDKLVIVTSGSTKPRLCINRLEANGNQAATKADSKMIDINDNNGNTWSADAYQTIEGNVYTINLKKIVADYGFVRLHSIKKQGWGDGVLITDLLLYTEPDPLASYKETLSEKIALASLYSSVGKTAASFDALTQAISDGETALAANDATEQSLTDATTAITDAINGLTLAENYTLLTKEMFKQYASLAEPGEGSNGNGAYELFTASGLPYGDGNVSELKWADLAAYDKLVIVTSGSIKPRLCINRLEAGGNQAATKAASKMIDINDNNGNTWSADAYQTIEGNVYTINLKKIVADYGFVRLHSIKKQGWGDGVLITDLLLYTEPDPLASYKETLSDKIAEAQAINTYAKTTASVEALNQAISDGEDALADAEATEKSLTDAVQAINDAIAGLKLADGYANLTEDMFKTWDSDTTPTTSSSAGCAYVLGTSTGQPYGDASVKWYHFADLSDFSTMYLLTTDGTPRVMMNRAYAAEGDGGDYVQLTDAPVDGKVTVNLTAYPYAHLNAIKGANWQNVTVTDMLLYRTITVGATGYATFGSLSKNAKLNGVTAYAAKLEGSSLKLTEVANVPAGKAVIIMAGAGSYAPTFDVAADDIESDLNVSNGTVTGDGSTIFALANGNSGIGFYLVKSGVTIPAGKAYLVVPALSREFIGFAGEETTGIKNCKFENATDNAVYNMNGQRMAQPVKGLYIINGKKTIVK